MYELHYWPGIQGRGEFVRLALECAGVEYVDVARQPPDQGGGEEALLREMAREPHEPFAPPYLKTVDLTIGQTANILLYIGHHHALAPSDEAGWLWVHQLQLTIADFVQEAHDVHHPISVGLYFKDQRDEALRRADSFRNERAPKFLGYFERVIERNRANSGLLVGEEITYADLSLFQAMSGMRFAFPKLMRRIERNYARCIRLHDRIAGEPRIAAYLDSPRRLPPSEHDLFRHYPELDEA